MEYSEEQLELCVLEGPQLGSKQPLQIAQAYCVGNAFDCDIYLRESADTPQKIEITIGRRSFTAVLLEGQANIDSQSMVQGKKYRHSLGIPVRIGGSLFAIQSVARGAVFSKKSRSEKSTDVLNTEEIHQYGMPQVWQKLHRPKLLIAVVTIVSFAVLTIAWKAALTPIPNLADSQSLEEIVRTTSNEEISVMAGAGGTYMVKGILASHDEQNRLTALLENREEDVVVKTAVAEDIEESVRDVFRTHGLQASVKTLKPGRLVARTRTADVESLARAEDAVRADVYGLIELNVINKEPVVDATTMSERRNSVDPGQSIRLVMVGSPSYVLTADASHYFIGSKLPTGHKIEAILKDKVVLLKNGVRTELFM